MPGMWSSHVRVQEEYAPTAMIVWNESGDQVSKLTPDEVFVMVRVSRKGAIKSGFAFDGDQIVTVNLSALEESERELLSTWGDWSERAGDDGKFRLCLLGTRPERMHGGEPEPRPRVIVSADGAPKWRHVLAALEARRDREPENLKFQAEYDVLAAKDREEAAAREAKERAAEDARLKIRRDWNALPWWRRMFRRTPEVVREHRRHRGFR